MREAVRTVGIIQKIPLVVGLAVQRNLPKEYTELLIKTVGAQLSALKKAYKNTPITVLSTLAPGMATLCARAALSAGCTLRAALPKEAQLYAEDFPEGSARDEYNELLSRCESSFTVPEYSEAPSPVAVENTFGEVSYKIPAAYYNKQAAIYLSKHCHLLLACWDGKKQAEDESAEDFTLDAMLLALAQPFSKMAGGGTAQNSGNVLLITTPAIRSPRTPKVLPIRTQFYSGGIERIVGTRGIRLKEFSYIERFNLDCTHNATLISKNEAAAKAVYLPPQNEAQLSSSEADLLCLLAQADILASHFQKIYTMIIYAFSLAVLGFFIFALGIGSTGSTIQLAAYLFLTLLAVLAYNFTGNKRYSKRYTRYRLLSQFLCVQFFMEISNIRDYFFSVPRWKRSAEISFAEHAAVTHRKTDWSATLPHNLDVVYKQWIDGEYFHYRYEAQERQNVAGMLQKLAAYALIASIILFFAVDISALLSRSTAVPSTGMVTKILLILIAAVVSFAIYKAGLMFTDERLRLSVKMYRSLGVAKRRVLAARKSYNRRVVLSLLLLLANTEITEALAWYSHFSPRTKYRSAKRRSIPGKKFRIPYYMRKKKRQTLT